MCFTYRTVHFTGVCLSAPSSWAFGGISVAIIHRNRASYAKGGLVHQGEIGLEFIKQLVEPKNSVIDTGRRFTR